MATTPYAATPTFPASFRMIPLKTTVVTPDEISPTKADTPSWHEDNSFLSEGRAHRNMTVLRFDRRCTQQIATPRTGDSAVASAAPRIPSLSGNIST